MGSIRFLSPLQLAVSVTVALSSMQVLADNSTWIARLTGNTSCHEGTVRTLSLGKAIQELEAEGFSVQEAKVARLDGRMFCMSCDCPDGTFNVIKLKGDEQVSELVNQGKWEKVEAKDIQVDDGNTHNQRILPVFPEK